MIPKSGELIRVRANGVNYKGQFLAMSDTELYLKSETRTWVVPLDRILSVHYLERDKEEKDNWSSFIKTRS